MSQRKDIRMTITLKNNALISHREKLQLTQKKMADFVEIPLYIYAGFEALKLHPSQSELLMKNAEALAATLETTVEDLFPESLTKIKINKKVMEVSSKHLRGQIVEPKQMYQIECLDLNNAVNAVLASLKPEEEKVLRMMFGLGDYEHTTDEVADYLNIHKESVYQIIAKTLRKIRHPRVSSILAEFSSDSAIERNLNYIEKYRV